MANSSLRWAVSLLIMLATPGTLAGVAGDEPIDVAAIDYCDPGLDAPALLAAMQRAVEQASPPQERLAEARLMLVQAGTELAAPEQGAAACRKFFKTGRARFEDALSRNTRRLRRESRARASADPGIARVQGQLGAQWLRDQAGRLTYLAFLPARDSGGAAALAHRLATLHIVDVDARSTMLMRGLLAEHDWIDSVRFGGKTSRQAWLLVQHADHDPAFQREALARMAAHLDTGGVRPRDYAYLHDRVAVNTGQLQRYGTQPAAQCKADSSLDPQPVEDPGTLNERRQAMGLGTVAEQMAQEAAQRCGR